MRIFILSLLLIIEIIIESTILPFFKIRGVTPDIVLITIISMGLIYGKKEGSILGLIGGLLSDIIFGKGFGLHSLPFMLIGYLMGLASERVYKENRIIPFLFTIIGTLCYHGIFYFIHYLSGVDFSIAIYIKDFTSLSVILNAILVIFMYPFLIKLSEWSLIR